MIPNRKLVYIGAPLSVFSGILLLIDLNYKEMPDWAIIVLMIGAVIGLGLCKKGGIFN